MILIRGIKCEAYARKIEKGIVDCRDILSALLEPPVTGYEYSDYYEKNLVKALSYFGNEDSVNLHNANFLYSLLIDFYIPHIYLTYFHVLNERSMEWLDKFEDDYHFIAMNVKIDRLTNTAIGNEYFGARMQYVNSIKEIEQAGNVKIGAACLCSIEDLFHDKRDFALSLNIYNTLSFPLLCREQDGKYTDIENEFRIIAYDCPRINDGVMNQIPREAVLRGKTGSRYVGTLCAGQNTTFESNLCMLKNRNKKLSAILEEEHGEIVLDSKFKPIDISTISDDYKYIGGKKECAEYIKRMVPYANHNTYVARTIERVYKIESLKNACFAPGYTMVEY